MINNIRFSQIAGGNGTKLFSMGPGPEGVFFNGPITEGVIDLGFSNTSKTFSLNDGTVFKCILSTDCTFSMPSPVGGRSFTLFLTQNGAYTATFNNVSWSNGVAPTITTGNGKTDILVFVSDGTCWYGNFVQNYSSCIPEPTPTPTIPPNSSSTSSSSSSEILPAIIYSCGLTGYSSIDNAAWTLSEAEDKINDKQYYTLNNNAETKIYWSSSLNLWILLDDSNIRSSTSNILGTWNNTTNNSMFTMTDTQCGVIYVCGSTGDLPDGEYTLDTQSQYGGKYIYNNNYNTYSLRWYANDSRWTIYNIGGGVLNTSIYSPVNSILGTWTDNTNNTTFNVQTDPC